MAPKIPSNKPVKATDRIKMASMLDKNGLLKQHDQSETAKQVIKSFEDCSMMKYITFDYQLVQKEEVMEWYLHAKI